MTHDDTTQRTDDATRIEELAAFLLARLDDDETAAQSALLGSAFLPFESLAQASDHGARHGPLRVLREVEAKRMGVLGWLEGLRAEREGRPATGPDVGEALVAALAAVFAQHPDFDPDWLSPPEEHPAPQPRPDNVVPLRARD